MSDQAKTQSDLLRWEETLEAKNSDLMIREEIAVHRFARFETIVRALLLMTATVTAVLGLLAPSSLTALSAKVSGGPDTVLFSVMAALCFGGWIDLLLDDLLPWETPLPWLTHWRHLGYLGIAACYAVLAFVLAGPGVPGAPILLTYYFGLAVCGVWYVLVASIRPEIALKVEK